MRLQNLGQVCLYLGCFDGHAEKVSRLLKLETLRVINSCYWYLLNKNIEEYQEIQAKNYKDDESTKPVSGYDKDENNNNNHDRIVEYGNKIPLLIYQSQIYAEGSDADNDKEPDIKAPEFQVGR